MSHTREHGGAHGPIRPSRKQGVAPRTVARKRVAVQLASGTPVLPVLIVSVIVVVDLLGGAGLTWLPLLAAGPALAATTNGPRGVLCVGLLAGVLGVTLGIRDGAPGHELAAALSALGAVTLASGLASALRGRRERVLAAVRSVAEAAQHALLQPVPAVVGPFQVAVRYSAAAAEARIGGDLYALVPTPYGVRLIVGDVRGKGLPAVGVAALVLGVFREAAYEEPDLLAVVDRIERSLARNLRCDDFVTAVVAGHPRPGVLELVNCGHAPPLLVRGSGVVPVEPAHPAPPLGLRALTGETPACMYCPSRTVISCCSTPTGSPRPATAAASSTRSPRGWRSTCPTNRRVPSQRSTTNCWRTWEADCTTTRRCSCSANPRLPKQRFFKRCP